MCQSHWFLQLQHFAGERGGNISSCLPIFMDYECSSNDIEMAEDEHVPNNTKCIDLPEDIEAAQCAIMAQDRTCGRFLKYKSCNSNLCLARPSLVLVFRAQLVLRPALGLAQRLPLTLSLNFRSSLVFFVILSLCYNCQITVSKRIFSVKI